MRGTVLQTAKYTESGIISGDDHNRYSFDLVALRNGEVSTGDHVDFEPAGSSAVGIYRLDQAPAPASFWSRNWLSLLFSLEGRVNRRDFWLIGVVAPLIAQVLFNQLGLIGVICSFVASWCSFALAVKRFHDLDRSGMWALIPNVLGIAAIVLYFVSPLLPVEFLWAITGTIITYLVMFIVLSKPGSSYVNQFGHPPA